MPSWIKPAIPAGCVTALCIAALAGAAVPSTAPSTAPATPVDDPVRAAIRATLKDYNDHIATKGAQWAQSIFYTTNDEERNFAKVICQYGADEALLYLAANDRFGPDGVKAVAQIMQDSTDEDVDSAVIYVMGNRARVIYTKHAAEPDHVILVNGKWLADTGADIAEYPGDHAAVLATIKAAADSAADMAKQLMAGQYSTLDQFKAALQAKLPSS
jgi:hypothetical protein